MHSNDATDETNKWMRKALRETQTLRAGCSMAEPKNFTPAQIPFLGVWDGQNLISWRWSLPSPTDPVWWGSMHTISSYCGNRPTNKHTNTQTHPHTNTQTHPHKHTPPARPSTCCKYANTQIGPITIHCAAKLSAQCKYHLLSENWKTSTTDALLQTALHAFKWISTQVLTNNNDCGATVYASNGCYAHIHKQWLLFYWSIFPVTID